MRLPHTLLIGLAVLLWAASRVLAPAMPENPEEIAALAIPGSGYGSLVARTMRSSLYTYWHRGEAYHAPAASPSTRPPQLPSANTPPPPPPAIPGVFSKRRLIPQPSSPAESSPPPPAQEHAPAVAEVPAGPPLDRAASWLNDLEVRRTKRSDRTPLSAAHRRYLNAATGWRLRLAYNLDPGDPMLYEILHDHILTTSQNVDQARVRSRLLTDKALTHAHSDHAGMADALTGMGAAINALNESMISAQPGLPPKEQLLANWQEILSCQRRYRAARAAAEREGWWKNIPSYRRMEISNHASFLDRIAKQVQDFMTKNGVVISHQ